MLKPREIITDPEQLAILEAEENARLAKEASEGRAERINILGERLTEIESEAEKIKTPGEKAVSEAEEKQIRIMKMEREAEERTIRIREQEREAKERRKEIMKQEIDARKKRIEEATKDALKRHRRDIDQAV
jgi:hypothetical protein